MGWPGGSSASHGVSRSHLVQLISAACQLGLKHAGRLPEHVWGPHFSCTYSLSTRSLIVQYLNLLTRQLASRRAKAGTWASYYYWSKYVSDSSGGNTDSSAGRKEQHARTGQEDCRGLFSGNPALSAFSLQQFTFLLYGNYIHHSQDARPFIHCGIKFKSSIS